MSTLYRDCDYCAEARDLLHQLVQCARAKGVLFAGRQYVIDENTGQPVTLYPPSMHVVCDHCHSLGQVLTQEGVEYLNLTEKIKQAVEQRGVVHREEEVLF